MRKYFIEEKIYMISKNMNGIQSYLWSDKCKLKPEWDSILYFLK